MKHPSPIHSPGEILEETIKKMLKTGRRYNFSIEMRKGYAPGKMQWVGHWSYIVINIS